MTTTSTVATNDASTQYLPYVARLNSSFLMEISKISCHFPIAIIAKIVEIFDIFGYYATV